MTELRHEGSIGRRRWLQRMLAGLLAVGVAAGLARAGAIVHPWRAAPTIVHRGEAFPILFHAEPGERITGVTLVSRHQRIEIPAGNVASRRGDFPFDPVLDARCTLRATVTVPAGSPADLYDLVVRTNRREVTSKHAVNVIREYRKRFTIVHISDTHIARNWVGDLKTGYPPGLEHLAGIVAVSNIIAPDFVAVTGDNIVNFHRNSELAEPDSARKWECFYEGSAGYKGIFGFHAPTFVVPGNHDCGVGVTDRTQSVGLYVELNGLRTYGFRYGKTRVIACDDVLGGYRSAKDIPAQFKALEAYLAEAGAGDMRILITHHPLRKDLSVPAKARHAFLDRNRIHLVLNGSAHRNRQTRWGTTPTLELTTKNAGIMEKDPGWFRVLVIEGDKLLVNRSLQYGDIETRTARLKLAYESPNDGTAEANKATITNGFDLAFGSCRVRFVMKPGRYAVTGGEVEQTYSADNVTVCDVRVPVAANAKAAVSIRSR